MGEIAPLDLDRQCGVLIAPLMNPCTRSLTCKIHAMGAKRAVEGRTQPFNELLAAYQKKGIGRPQGKLVECMSVCWHLIIKYSACWGYVDTSKPTCTSTKTIV